MPNKGKLAELGEGSATHHQEDCDCYSLEELLAHGHLTPEDFGGWVKAPSPADSGDHRDESLPPELFGLGPGSSSEVHDRLVRLSVTRIVWEGVSEETRETVRETLGLITWLELNIKSLLDGSESAERYAKGMLRQYLDLKKEETERFKGFRQRTLRGLFLRAARDLLNELKEVLKSVKEEDKSVRRDSYAKANWLDEKAAEVNAVIKPHLVEDERAPCTPEIIQQLKTESPDTIARLLVGQVFQDVSADALRRPMVRRRPSK